MSDRNLSSFRKTTRFHKKCQHGMRLSVQFRASPWRKLSR